MGYVEETGVAQHYRDIRIAPIYEGTNGIQAIDLVGRKLGLRGGAAIAGYLDGIAAMAAQAQAAGGELAAVGAALADGVATVRMVTDWLGAVADPNDALAGATPYLRMMGLVTGAWLLTRSALAADELGGDLAAQKLVTAHFFATQVLPQVSGLAPAVTAGAADLFTRRCDQLVAHRHVQGQGVGARLDGRGHRPHRSPRHRGDAAAAALDDGHDRAERAPGGAGEGLGLGPSVGDGGVAQRGDSGRGVGDGERHTVERELVTGDLGGGVDEPSGVVGRNGDRQRRARHV